MAWPTVLSHGNGFYALVMGTWCRAVWLCVCLGKRLTRFYVKKHPPCVVVLIISRSAVLLLSLAAPTGGRSINLGGPVHVAVDLRPMHERPRHRSWSTSRVPAHPDHTPKPGETQRRVVAAAWPTAHGRTPLTASRTKRSHGRLSRDASPPPHHLRRRSIHSISFTS